MSKQSAENYLDELLNSVNGGKKTNETVETKEAPENAGVIRTTAKAEAEFLMEFEQELAGEDFDDLIKVFEDNDILPEDRLDDFDVNLTEEDALLSMLGTDDTEDIAAKPVEEEVARSKEHIVEEISLEELALSGIDVEEIGIDGMEIEESDLSEDSGVGPTEAIDLSQMGEEDLISLLAGTDSLADIGELLSQNDNELPVESEDPFALYASNEMAEQTDAAQTDNADKGKSTATKKGSLLQKLSQLLFGKDNEEESITPVSLTPDASPSVEELADENADILAVFAEAEKVETPQKADTKKNKKEKKKKEPKEKKPAKPKAPKKQKEKKPKEKDNTPPLPKGPVAVVCLLAISIFVLVFFGAQLISYSSAISKAKDSYKKGVGHYAEAAEYIAGVEVKKDDEMLQGKIKTLAAVDSQISEYQVFMKNDRKAEALDSLISAAGRAEINHDNALKFECVDEMDVLKDKIAYALDEQFNLTYEEVIELYKLTERDRDEYTIELNKIMKELGIIEE